MAMSDTSLPARRQVSPLSSLDRGLFKQLCELHPWDLSRLSAAVKLTPSVLSHVFAGRRPLPQKVAHKLLSLLGMTPSGELNRSHLFVLQSKAGAEPQLLSFLERLFPEGAEVVDLNDYPLDKASEDIPPDHETKFGFALSDGKSAALIRGCSSDWVVGKDTDRWPVISSEAGAEALLNEDRFPPKSEVVALVSRVPAFNQRVRDADWELVRNEAESRGVTASMILAYLRTTPAGDLVQPRTLFPLVQARQAKSGG